MSATDKAIPLNPECCRPEIGDPVFDKPYLTILPSSGRASLQREEVWQYRELLYFLIWRDIKLRYKQTALGAIWAIIQPLLPMLDLSHCSLDGSRICLRTESPIRFSLTPDCFRGHIFPTLSPTVRRAWWQMQTW